MLSAELRSTLSLASGRAVAFGATFVVPVILARLFAPAEFGAYKQLFLIFGTLLIIGQFGMGESLFYFLPRAPERAGRYVANSLLFLAVAGALGLLVLWIEGPALAAWLNNPELARHLPMLGLFLLLMTMSFVLEIVVTARRQYGLAAWSYGVSDVVRGVCFAAGALLTRSLEGLLWAAVLFALCRLAVTLVYVVRTFDGGLRPDLACFREQFAYVAPFSVAVLLEYGYRNLHQYAVSTGFDPATFAVYSVGCLQIPIMDALVSSASNVLMVRMGEELHARRTTGALQTWREATHRMAAFTIPLAALLIVIGRDLIVALFTKTYEASAPIFVVTALAFVPGLLMTDSVLRVYAQTRFLVLLNVVRLLTVVMALLLLMPTFGLVGAALASLVATVVAKGVALVRMRRLMDASTWTLLPWRSLATITAASATAGVIAAIAGAGVEAHVVVRIALATTVYVVTYAVCAAWWGVVSEATWRSLLSRLSVRRQARATAPDNQLAPVRER
jgi:O-antigen/teichoic acid export membrane protein